MGDIAVFHVYDPSNITDIFCLTLVGQDLPPFEVQKLASGMEYKISRLFHGIDFSLLFSFLLSHLSSLPPRLSSFLLSSYYISSLQAIQCVTV
jgi:hypothetical protein